MHTLPGRNCTALPPTPCHLCKKLSNPAGPAAAGGVGDDSAAGSTCPTSRPAEGANGEPLPGCAGAWCSQAACCPCTGLLLLLRLPPAEVLLALTAGCCGCCALVAAGDRAAAGGLLHQPDGTGAGLRGLTPDAPPADTRLAGCRHTSGNSAQAQRSFAIREQGQTGWCGLSSVIAKARRDRVAGDPAAPTTDRPGRLTLCATGTSSSMNVPPAGFSTPPPPQDLPPRWMPAGGDSASSAAVHVTLLAHGGFSALATASRHSARLWPRAPPPLTAPFMLLQALPVAGVLPPNSPASASACAALALGLRAAATAVARSLDEDDLAPSSEGPVTPGPLCEPLTLAGGLQGVLACCCMLAPAPLPLVAAPGLLVAGGGVLGGSEGSAAAAAAGSSCCPWNAAVLRARLLLCRGEQMAALMAANLRSIASAGCKSIGWCSARRLPSMILSKVPCMEASHSCAALGHTCWGTGSKAGFPKTCGLLERCLTRASAVVAPCPRTHQPAVSASPWAGCPWEGCQAQPRCCQLL